MNRHKVLIVYKGKCPDKNCAEHEYTKNETPYCPECDKKLIDVETDKVVEVWLKKKRKQE